MTKLFNKTISELIGLLDSSFGDGGRYDISSDIYNLDLFDDLQIVKSYCEKSGDLKILDLGCGKGHITALSSVLLDQHISGVDLYNSFGEGGVYNTDSLGEKWQDTIWSKLSSKYDVDYTYYNGKNLPYANNTFDVVIAYAVLEHVDDRMSFLKDAYRVLRRGGHLFIFRCPSSLSYSENLSKLLGIPHHDNLFTVNKLQDMFQNVGFKTLSLEKYDSYFAFSPVKRFQDLWNKLMPVHLVFRNVLSCYPFKIFAHHFRAVLEK